MHDPTDLEYNMYVIISMVLSVWMYLKTVYITHVHRSTRMGTRWAIPKQNRSAVHCSITWRREQNTSSIVEEVWMRANLVGWYIWSTFVCVSLQLSSKLVRLVTVLLCVECHFCAIETRTTSEKLLVPHIKAFHIYSVDAIEFGRLHRNQFLNI